MFKDEIDFERAFSADELQDSRCPLCHQYMGAYSSSWVGGSFVEHKEIAYCTDCKLDFDFRQSIEGLYYLERFQLGGYDVNKTEGLFLRPHPKLSLSYIKKLLLL